MNRKVLLKKLLHRSANMGCKELDIVMGGFAQSHLSSLSDKELLQYQKILETNDTILYTWICGRSDVDNAGFYDIIELIKNSISLKVF